MLIKPKEVQIKDVDGIEKTFVISRLPAVTGREILAKYPLSNTPKIGDYEVSKEAMLKMMAYVCAVSDGEEIPLKTQTLIDNHVPDGESLIRLELEMLKYNTSFFGTGGNSGFLPFLISKVGSSLPSVIKTLMASLQSSSAKDSPPSPNSKPQ
ncbi:phage-like protein [Morganella morganii]|uniref:Phage-like protein n=1 Tax=Morganella morganii TaxID=582 RepID=A0A0D8L8W5_MORMO|nr:phage-like protein [Morganella morganii]